MDDFHDGEDGLVGDGGVGLELGEGALDHVDIHVRGRAEAPALDQDGLFVEHLAGLEHVASGVEHGRAR